MGSACTSCNTCKGQEGKMEFETNYVTVRRDNVERPCGLPAAVSRRKSLAQLRSISIAVADRIYEENKSGRRKRGRRCGRTRCC